MPNEQGVSETETSASGFGDELLYSANFGGQIITQDDSLRIGVGAIRYGEYTNGNSEVKPGVIANLSIFVRDHPELERNVDIYEGQTLIINEQRIRVIDIDIDEQLVIVEIAVQTR